MPTTSPGSALSPAELKDMGNKLYTQRKYDEAIERYRLGYFSKKQLCHLDAFLATYCNPNTIVE